MLELDPDAVVWSQDGATLCSEVWKSDEGPTLSNDIWSKFDLLLTPPRTPLRDTDFDPSSLPDDLFPLLEGDDFGIDLKLDPINLDTQFTSDVALDFPLVGSCSHGQVHDTCSSCQKLALVGSELRHDCMWVGTCTAEAHANQKNRIHHDSTCSHVSDLLMDSQGALDAVAGLTHLDDFHDNDEDDDEDSDATASQMDHEDALAYNHMPRPDTPSESSETDTEDENERHNCNSDSGVEREEEIYTSGSPSSSGVVHSDHTYHCLLPSSPSPKHIPRARPRVKSPSSPPPSLLQTPSDSEDEIDVVSVGASSSDSAYSCSTRTSKRSTSSSGVSSKRNKSNVILSCSSDGAKKIYRIHTSSSTVPSSPSSKVKKHFQESVAEGVKGKQRRAAAAAAASAGGKAPSSVKSPKRLLLQRGVGGSRKRASQRTESDDPDKREMHNSLERMRRVDLRNAFEELRTLIPDLVEKEKAPKVEILKKASQYCHSIYKQENSLLAEVEQQRKRNSILLKQLHTTRRQLGLI